MKIIREYVKLQDGTYLCYVLKESFVCNANDILDLCELCLELDTGISYDELFISKHEGKYHGMMMVQFRTAIPPTSQWTEME
ncbi:MAG: hypothetical protein HC917_28700 [Richelia sp. SM2_1_7]|nr:hypothetical protein [Richelia sp. SM2_1_7]